jgi:predicted metalloprotease with PDZ domain
MPGSARSRLAPAAWLLIRTLLALLVLAGSSAAWAAQNRAEYTLVFSEKTPKRFRVLADIPVLNGELTMAPRLLAEPLPNGWADFIEHLSAKDMKNRPIALTHLGSGRWKLGRPVTRVKLAYDVVLKHDDVRWAISGLFARAYAVDDAIFFFGHTAFIKGTPEFKLPARIRFKTPESWEAVTALPQIRGQRDVYEAANWDDLILTGSMVGRLSRSDTKFGQLHAAIAAPQALKPSVDVMGEAIRTVVGTVTRDLGGAPEGKFGVFFAVTPRSHGGETTDDTISTLFKAPPDFSNKLSLYVIVHEIFHLWNAVAIAAQNGEEAYWLSEGFTAYGAYLALYRSGLLSEAEFLGQIAEAYERYISGGGTTPAGRIALTEAGADKSKNYNLIYDGGLLVALALDIEARAHFNDPDRGFLELMRLAFTEFGKTGTEYTQADLRRLAGRSIGADATPFFDRYVEGKEVLPVAAYLKKVGLELTTVNGKSTITRNDGASAAQLRLYPGPSGK